MAEIIKVYKEHLPKLRFIGKRYTNANRVGGSYGAKWGEWFQNGWFNAIERPGGTEGVENGYLGLMRCSDSDFEYWIGAFLPPDASVPDGYGFIDIDEGYAGVCWIKGKEEDGSVFLLHDECVAKLQESGMSEFRTDEENRVYFFERYNCPRFTEKDGDGNVILDYGALLA